MALSHVKVGLIGGGGIATEHIKGYQRFADKITIAAIADANESTAAQRAQELGVPGYTDYRTMLDEADVDAVDICLPHHLHCAAIVSAAERGKHILCEKPLCLTAEEARIVQDVVKSSGVTLMSAHNMLFSPDVAKAKELIDEGVIGALYEIQTMDCFYNDFDPAAMGWRGHAKTSGGGELIDSGYHPTYQLLYLAGGTPLETTAMLSNHRLDFMEGEDSAHVLLRFDNDVVGHIVTSWAYAPAPSVPHFSAVGGLGSLSSTGNSLTYRLLDGTTETFEFEPTETIPSEIGYFADCLISGVRPLHSEKEGIEALAIILAAYEAARTGTTVPINLPELASAPGAARTN